MDLEEIKKTLTKFADERNWQRFHSPKNLAMALSVEAAELLELFQWLSEAESETLGEKDRERATQELADIQIYLIRLADKLKIDIEQAVLDKMRINAEKYPVDLSRNNATKYNRR